MKDISEYTNELYKRIDEKTEALEKRPPVGPWMKWAAAAAVFVVVVAGALVALNVTGAWRNGGVASSGSGSVGSEDGSISTDYGTNYPPVPASDSPRTDPAQYDPSLPHGGDDRLRLTNYMYLDDRLTSFDTIWHGYIAEEAAADLSTLFKSTWRTPQGSAFSLIEIIKELNTPKEKFVELNNKKLKEIRAADYFTEDVIFRDYCFTDEEIDIIYSGDKKRIAEAFANPYAVIADDWEIYPLRWIINNPASLYKEKQISLKALEAAAHNLIDQGESQISDEDSAAILARIEEYKEMQ